MIITDNYKPKHHRTVKSRLRHFFQDLIPKDYTPKHPRIPEKEEPYFEYEWEDEILLPEESEVTD